MKYRMLGPALALLAAVVYFGAELYLFERPAFPLDDSWIHLQFAERLAAGDGLTYNLGERANGSTAPLWTALLSVGFLLPGGLPLLWPKLLGFVLLLVTVRATGRLAEALGMPPWSRHMAEIMIGTCHWWIWSALSAMEILLFSALSLWGLIAHQRELELPGSAPLSIALLSAACLARPEGLLLLALALFERAIDEKPDLNALGLGLATAALVLIPTAVYYQWTGGSPLPTTFQVKTHSDSNLMPDMGYLRLVLYVLWGSQPILALLALAGGVRLLAAGSKNRRLLPFLWLVGQPLAYAVIASEDGPQPMGNFGRYYFPLFPVLIVLGLSALEPLVKSPPLSLARWKLPWRPVLTVLLLLPQTFQLLPGPGRYLQTVANVEDSDVRMAYWLKDRLPPGARLGVQDIGALKFILQDHYVVDLAGIVTAETRELLHQDEPGVYWENRLAATLQRADVDYLVLFAESYPGLSNPGSGFKPMHRLTVENNVTMAGKELVVLKTPWTNAPDLVPDP